MALAVSACGGAAQTATPVPATPTAAPATAAPATAAPATAAPATAAPSPTLLPIAVEVTFDGATCKYSGPTVIPRDAAVTFTMTNTPAAVQGPSGAAALAVMPVVDGTTWQEILDTAATTPMSTEPEWVFLPDIGDKAIQILFPESAAMGTTLRVIPTMDLDYLVLCGTGPDETDKVFPAILLEILPKA